MGKNDLGDTFGNACAVSEIGTIISRWTESYKRSGAYKNNLNLPLAQEEG